MMINTHLTCLDVSLVVCNTCEAASPLLRILRYNSTIEFQQRATMHIIVSWYFTYLVVAVCRV